MKSIMYNQIIKNFDTFFLNHLKILKKLQIPNKPDFYSSHLRPNIN